VGCEQMWGQSSFPTAVTSYVQENFVSLCQIGISAVRIYTVPIFCIFSEVQVVTDEQMGGGGGNLSHLAGDEGLV
jgi:hypothetical protein